MNKLPKVLQKEIWEYVHGDRTFWRNQFGNCLTDILLFPQVDRYIRIDHKTGLRLRFGGRIHRIQTCINGNDSTARFQDKIKWVFELTRPQQKRIWYDNKEEALRALNRFIKQLS